MSVAEARRINAALRPNPVITLSADHLDLLGTRFNAMNNAGPTEYAIRTDFVIERGGKRALRMALAEAELLADRGSQLVTAASGPHSAIAVRPFPFALAT